MPAIAPFDIHRNAITAFARWSAEVVAVVASFADADARGYGRSA
jgi:hypothetical protein